MRTSERPHLDTVVILQAFDGSGQWSGAGTGFLCRAPHYHRPTQKYLFLVTAAHVVRRNDQQIDVRFRAPEGAGTVIRSVDTREGPGPGTWFLDRTNDLAALLLDPACLPEHEIQTRCFDVEADTLSIRELRRLDIAEGTEGLLVGFVEQARDASGQTPGFRSVTVAGIPRRWRGRAALVVEGTAFPGNSGSPVILRPERGFGGHGRAGPDGKLIGIVQGLVAPNGVVASDDVPGPIQIEETATLVHLVPVDALRRLLADAVGRIILAETFGATVRRVRGWVQRNRG
jgi:hypothetical protein